MMKRKIFCLICVVCLSIAGGTVSNSWAIEAFFDSEISTDVEAQSDTGTLFIRMIDEDVPPVFTEVVYEQIIQVEIIFDASKTMMEPDINGIRKIDIAKSIVSILVNNFPQRSTRFALRVNGARYANNCLDSELVIPFDRGNGQQVLQAVKKIQPKGFSPIAYSLRQILEDFDGTKGARLVFLITDGLETCDVEPADACTFTMDLLQQAEFEGNIHVIGINTVYDDARALLSCLAARGKGEYLDSNRNKSEEFAKLIEDSQQLRYSISRIFDAETLKEGKILELINLKIGDFTAMERGKNIAQYGEARREAEANLELFQDFTAGYDSPLVDYYEDRLEGQADQAKADMYKEATTWSTEVKGTGGEFSMHKMEPGIYKLSFATVPPLTSYFTIDRQQELNVGIVRSGNGLDLHDRAHLALGNQYYDRGQVEQAVEEYEKVLELDPRNIDAHLNLGIIYHDILKDSEKASDHYKMYLELAGPRQEEVSSWLRQVRGLPTVEEELQQKLREREEQKAREEAERKAREEQERLEKERQKALDAYEEIRTANPEIVELAQEEVISGDVLNVIVSTSTTDSKALDVAMDIGDRMQELLERAPEILVYRESKPEEVVVRIMYDASQQQYRSL